MRLRPEHKLFFATAITIALLGALVLAAFYTIKINRGRDAWVRHTYEVARSVVRIRALATDAELAHHSFISTGDSRFLNAVATAQEKLPLLTARLIKLVGDNPEQLEAAKQLVEAVNHRLERLKTMAAQGPYDANKFRSREYWDLSKLEIDKIQLICRGMIDREDILLKYRVEAAETASRYVQIEAGLFLIIGVGATVLVYRQMHRQLTKRREAEALRQSESRFRTVADKVPSILWQVDAEGKSLFINRTWFDYTGSTPEDFQRDGGQSFIHPEDWPLVVDNLMQCVNAGKVWQQKFRIRSRTGAYGWFLGHAIPLFGADGKLECFVGQSVEITELHRIQEALMAEKQKLAVTLHSIGDGVVTTDTEGRVYLLNREGEYLTGWSQSEAAGKPLHEVFRIVHEFTRLPIEDPVKKVLRTGRTVELANHTVLISRDGKERIIADSAAPIRDSEGKVVGTVLVFRDSTQKEKLAEEMLRSSKLESLGVLAGGIAHDFNNLLATVLGNISLLERFPDDREGGLGCIKESRQACLRAKDLTQQLLTFAKGGVPVKKLSSLREVISESTRFALHGSSAQLILDIAPDLCSVMMDASQISQVLHNIVLNAAQAMPDGGVVKVQAVNAPDHPSGRMVRVSISDTGVGIKPEHQIKIFDPYFTTKPTGTGLGLASAYSIIKKHEGDLSVESIPGSGTTFTILLPAHDEQAQVLEPDVVHDGLETGHGRLLVLEDDQMLARMLKLMLTNLGYEVSVAHTGNQAIEIYRQAMTSAQPFSGCIIDLTLAGSINGAETLDHIQQIDPNVKALVCSGYSNDQIVADFKKHGFCGMVTKPYAIEDIAHAVHVMLSTARP